jgi:hypothetical protein
MATSINESEFPQRLLLALAENTRAMRTLCRSAKCALVLDEVAAEAGLPNVRDWRPATLQAFIEPGWVRYVRTLPAIRAGQVVPPTQVVVTEDGLLAAERLRGQKQPRAGLRRSGESG